MVNRSPITDFGFYTSVLQEVMKSLYLVRIYVSCEKLIVPNYVAMSRSIASLGAVGLFLFEVSDPISVGYTTVSMVSYGRSVAVYHYILTYNTEII